jgi:hypothetical protein
MIHSVSHLFTLQGSSCVAIFRGQIDDNIRHFHELEFQSLLFWHQGQARRERVCGNESSLQ